MRIKHNKSKITEQERKYYEERLKDPQFIIDIKIMKKWLISFIIWTIICFSSLLFIKSYLCIGLWLFVIGITMHVKRKKYEQWYIRMYGIDYLDEK